MSLFEKANRGTEKQEARTDSSLFNKALAARVPRSQPPVEEFDTGGFEELEGAIAALPSTADSILQLWSLVGYKLPLESLALFLPRKDSMALAAQKGFRFGKDGILAMNLVDRMARPGEVLDASASSVIAPLLGSSGAPCLRSSLVWPKSGLFGLWVYSDPRLQASTAETQVRLGELLAHAGQALPPPSLAEMEAEPARLLLESALKFESCSAFVFDLSVVLEGRDKGIHGETLRSAFLAACSRILSQGGLALAFGSSRVGCVLASAPTLDPDLALFQFTKTLRRILPFLAAASFPEGRALRVDPSSGNALEELARFLDE
jgi:hypothetical protein